MSATYTPAVPLLPNTYYRFYQAGGYYDTDGSYMYGNGSVPDGLNTYFTTGNGSDLTAPDVASISPANSASSVPLNAQVLRALHFRPIDPDAVELIIITVTPAGGSAINGNRNLLASDLGHAVSSVALDAACLPTTQFTVQVSGLSGHEKM